MPSIPRKPPVAALYGDAGTARGAAFLAVALALLMGLGALWAFTRNNDFPLDYHPDERGKVHQITDPAQGRNFNHSLLMLEAANTLRAWTGVQGDERAVAILGRWTSAGLAAVAVLAFALAGYCFGGYLGLLLCGGMTALCPALSVYAHFFKEDTALLAGVAVALLGANWLVTAERGWRQGAAAVLMGLGCGAATSGKYVGAVTLAPCLIALLLAPPPRLSRLLGFAGAAAASAVAINLRGFHSLFPPRLAPAASQQLTGEFLHATTGHDGLALPIPNAFSLNVAASEWLPHVWLFLALGLVLALWRGGVDRRIATTAGFLLSFAVALGCSAFPFPRYALPITALGYFAAGQLLAAGLQRLAQPSLAHAAGALCLLAAVAAQGERCWRFNGQFADDSRQRLREWVARNLGEQDTVLAGDFTSLDGPGDPWRHPRQGAIAAQIVRNDSAAGRASDFARLRAAGVGYIAVAEPKYERYFRPGIHTVGYAREPELARRQEFYRKLFAEAQLVWSSAPSPPSHAYVDPEIRLYRLPGAPASR